MGQIRKSGQIWNTGQVRVKCGSNAEHTFNCEFDASNRANDGVKDDALGRGLGRDGAKTEADAVTVPVLIQGRWRRLLLKCLDEILSKILNKANPRQWHHHHRTDVHK